MQSKLASDKNKDSLNKKINPKVNQQLCNRIINDYKKDMRNDLNKYYSKTNVDDLMLLYNYDCIKNTDIISLLCVPF